MKPDLESRFEQLYRNNSRDLYVYIVRSVIDENAAADLLQDTFLNFFKVYRDKELPDDTGCRMYLFRAARNLIINYSKTRYKKSVTLVDTYPESAGISDKGSPENSLMRQEAFDKAESVLRQLLQQLDEKNRTALILKYQEDMRLEDIARLLDTSVSTVSRMITKAQKQLLEDGKKVGFRPEDLF